MKDGDVIVIDGKEFKFITLRGRSKLVAKDGELRNPYHKNQKPGLYYNPDGYPCTGGGVPIHLYVAHAWVDGYDESTECTEVNHKDFNRTNYHSDNLEWMTHYDNVQHSAKYNREVVCESKRGVNNGRATFTEDEVKAIRRQYDDGMTIAEIVRFYHPELKSQKDYHSIWSTYANIVHRRTWKHI